MGFGLCNAPATYSRVMNLVLRGLTWKTVLAFLDDVVVLGTNFRNHIDNLKDVLLRFRSYGLKLKPKKCVLFQREIEFLGRKVSSNTLTMTEQDIKVVCEWPKPACAKDLERFMGLTNYHRGFVPNFSELADPLYAVLGKRPFKWEQEQENAFNALKTALTEPPVMSLPNQHDEFILDTDASDRAIGAELLQVQNGEEKVIAYGSYSLTPEQRRYCVTRKELLAVVRFTRQYRHYLLGRPFIVRTDHASLVWLLRFKAPQGQLARWMEELSQYNMILKHRAGSKHGNADALSRIQIADYCNAYSYGVKLESLPCGGCAYCARAEHNWTEFTEEMDVGPICPRGSDPPYVACSQGEDGERDRLQVGREIQHSMIKERMGPVASKVDVCPVAGTERVRSKHVSPGASIEEHVGPVAGAGMEHIFPDVSSERQTDSVCTGGDTVVGMDLVNNCGMDLDSVVSEDSEIQGVRAQTVEPQVVKVSGQEVDQVIWPWEPGGCSDLGEEGVHVEVVTKGDHFIVLNCGVSQGSPEVSKTPSSWGFSVAELQEAQGKDKDLELILNWLETSVQPDEASLFIASRATKSYWLNKEQFVLINGVLYRTRDECDEKDLVVPESLRQIALEWNHDIPSSGHQGVVRTRARMRDKFLVWNVI